MNDVKMSARLPVDVARYLKEQAKRNFTSSNAELIRSVRERMAAEAARADAAIPGLRGASSDG